MLLFGLGGQRSAGMGQIAFPFPEERVRAKSPISGALTGPKETGGVGVGLIDRAAHHELHDRSDDPGGGAQAAGHQALTFGANFLTQRIINRELPQRPKANRQKESKQQPPRRQLRYRSLKR